MQTIAIDPHRRSHTAVAVSASGVVEDEIRVVAGPKQVDRLLAFASRWPTRRWAVEGANGVGRLLAQQLVSRGEVVVDVPATLAARVRLLSGKSGRKTDPDDARSVAVAALHHPRLQVVEAEDHAAVLRLLSDRRAHLSRARTQALSRLHDLLCQLTPGGANKKSLTAAQAAVVLRRIRPQSYVAQQRKAVARDLLDDIRRLDRELNENERRIEDAVAVSGTSLVAVRGVGAITAARIIGQVGNISRFESRAHFASYCGSAPIEASSGDVRRHRLSRRGNRQLNSALHIIAISQMRTGAGREFYLRKLAEQKTPGEARRALKRHLANVVFAHLVADAQRVKVGPGGQMGTTLHSSVAEPTPTPGTSDRSLPGPELQATG